MKTVVVLLSLMIIDTDLERGGERGGEREREREREHVIVVR